MCYKKHFLRYSGVLKIALLKTILGVMASYGVLSHSHTSNDKACIQHKET